MVCKCHFLLCGYGDHKASNHLQMPLGSGKPVSRHSFVHSFTLSSIHLFVPLFCLWSLSVKNRGTNIVSPIWIIEEYKYFWQLCPIFYLLSYDKKCHKRGENFIPHLFLDKFLYFCAVMPHFKCHSLVPRLKKHESWWELCTCLGTSLVFDQK